MAAIVALAALTVVGCGGSQSEQVVVTRIDRIDDTWRGEWTLAGEGDALPADFADCILTVAADPRACTVEREKGVSRLTMIAGATADGSKTDGGNEGLHLTFEPGDGRRMSFYLDDQAKEREKGKLRGQWTFIKDGKTLVGAPVVLRRRAPKR